MTINHTTIPQEPSPPDRSGDPQTANDNRKRRSRLGLVAGLAIAALAVGAVGLLGGARPLLAEAGLHSGRADRAPLTIEEARDHAEFFASFLLHRLDASEDQKSRILAIVGASVDQAHPLIEQHRAHRQALGALLAKPTIDRAELERLRAGEIALADQLSRTLTSAIADSAEVLTAEQRAGLVERLHRFHR